MLYVTTLDRTVTYTAQATLERATGPEGGLFVPMTLPQYDRKGLAAVLALPFWDCVASILNQFFPCASRVAVSRERMGCCRSRYTSVIKLRWQSCGTGRPARFRAFGPTCATGWAPSSAPGELAFCGGGHCAAVWPLRRCVPVRLAAKRGAGSAGYGFWGVYHACCGLVCPTDGTSLWGM